MSTLALSRADINIYLLIGRCYLSSRGRLRGRLSATALTCPANRHKKCRPLSCTVFFFLSEAFLIAVLCLLLPPTQLIGSRGTIGGGGCCQLAPIRWQKWQQLLHADFRSQFQFGIILIAGKGKSWRLELNSKWKAHASKQEIDELIASTRRSVTPWRNQSNL